LAASRRSAKIHLSWPVPLVESCANTDAEAVPSQRN
jgi:hypothetical protein